MIVILILITIASLVAIALIYTHYKSLSDKERRKRFLPSITDNRGIPVLNLRGLHKGKK